jgi:hypothetical protein
MIDQLIEQVLPSRTARRSRHIVRDLDRIFIEAPN